MSRYRKWDLGNDIKLVARCEHDAVMQGPNNEMQFINIKALNEWDSKVIKENLFSFYLMKSSNDVRLVRMKGLTEFVGFARASTGLTMFISKLLMRLLRNVSGSRLLEA